MNPVKENLPLIVEHYPFYKSVNEKIVKDSEGAVFHKEVNMSSIQASQTVSRKIHSESIDKIYNWIITILQSKFCSHPNLGIYDFEIDNSWLAVYDKGEYTKCHAHYPFSFSFVYFVKSPKGSSPLVLSTSGKRMKPEEGKVVIFPSSLQHHVPKNRCDGRMILAGNLLFMQRKDTTNDNFEYI